MPLHASPPRVEILPAAVDFVLYRGDTFIITIKLTQNDVPVPLDNSVVTATLSYPDGRPLMSMGTDVVAPGTVQVFLTTEQMQMMPLTTVVWDLQVMTGIQVRTWARGRVATSKDITP